MKKIVKLSESDLTKIIKRVVNEADEPEPVLTDYKDTCTAELGFSVGQTKFNEKVSKQIKEFILSCLITSFDTIERFQDDPKFKLPQVVTFHVGTSSSGTFDTNQKVAKGRMDYLTKLYLDAMKSVGIRADVAFKLVTQSYKSYTPSKVNTKLYDPSKTPDWSSERTCFITVEPITTKGKNRDTIGKIGGKLIDASSFMNTYLYDNVDEDTLTQGIKTLETYSDLKDIDRFLQDSRIDNLQDFLNDQLFDDPTHLSQIKDHINTIAKRSGKGTVAQIVGGKISIILENKVVRLTESDLVKIVKRVIREN